MARITIRTNAYARNRNFAEISDALHDQGFSATPNTAIDGVVSIDTNATAAIVTALVKGRPASVWIERL